MWWGGSGDQEGSPPPDPSGEQGDFSQEDPTHIKQELGDLQEQFDQQQALIGQLKDMLKKKESALSSREKEVESYAARLAKMKPRLGRAGAKNMPVLAERVETVGSSQDSLSTSEEAGVVGAAIAVMHGAAEGKLVEDKKLPSSESGSRAKILLLRKQLEENRLKFERQQKENAEKRASMEEMKLRIDRLRIEVEQRDSLIQSLQEGRGIMSDESITQKLYQQIVYKDNSVLELTQKIGHLEELIQEQRETLSEKDRVIEARTEAVSLVAKAQDEKSLKTLEELEEVRYQMKKMQEDFVIKEQEFASEKESLTKELKEKVKKVTQLEENGRRLENLRFELSTRNAELQEKIVTLQADAKILRNQSESDRKTVEEKDSLLQELKQKLVRAEAHGQKKMKALEKQLRNIRQDGNAGEQILELQNSIAELEEEKGNLQLKLVDFDDLKSANEKLTVLRNKLEDQVKHLNSDLDSQLSAITQLETEKIKLVEGTNERENRIFDLESELNVTKTSLAEVTQAKVTLELRLCEVEEQRDTSEKGRMELENQMTESGMAPVEQLMAEKGSLEESLQSLLKERNEWEAKYVGQISTVQECEDNMKVAMQEKETKVKECKRLMNILTDKENTIATLSIKIDKHDAVLADIEDRLKLALEDVKKKNNELEEVNHRLQQEVERACALSKTIEDLETKNSLVSSELQTRETKMAVISETVETLNRSLNEKNITIQNLVGEVSSLQDQVRQKDKSINDHINRLEQLESQINIRDNEIEELHTSVIQREEHLSKKNVDVDKLKTELTNISHQLEASKASFESEMNVLSTMLSDSNNQVQAAHNDIEIKVKEIQNNQIMISKYEQEICDKNMAFDELQDNAKNLQAKVSSLGSSLSEKEASILQLQTELEEKTSYLENLKAQLATSEQKLHHLQEENLTLATVKSNLEEEICDIKSVIHQKEENILHLNSEMTSKSYQQNQDIDMLRQTLVEKEQQISVLETSVGNLKSETESKASEIEKWQTEALEKTERLTEVTRELEYLQLQVGEKDVVIRDLHSQLAQNQEQLACSQEQMSHAHNQLVEVKEQLAQNEDQLAEARSHLTETQIHLAQVQEQMDRTQEQLVVTQTDFKETESQHEKVTALASQFEEQLRLKATDLETMEKEKESSIKELETARTELQHQKSEISRLQMELKTNKDLAENLELSSSKIQEWATQLQSELDKAKLNQDSAHKDLGNVKEELTSRINEMKQLQHVLEQEQEKANSLQAELTKVIASQQQHEQRADSLQTELTQALSLQQQSESEVAALSLTQQQKITHLEADLLSVTQTRDQLQSEFEKNSLQLQNHVETISHLNASFENLMSQIVSKDGEIEILQKGIVEHQNAKSEVESSLREITKAKIQLENQLQLLHTEVSSLPDESPKADAELIRLGEELAVTQDQKRFLEEECDGLRADANTLKQQLQEARQTITQLQTSLATQSQSTATPSPGWEDWGEVDLGTPDPKEVPGMENPLVISLQKSLADKDKMLVMIQDQLKEALQQINTITEEKKVLEQQKKSAEVSSAHQKQQWEQDQEELLAMKNKLEDFDAIKSTLEKERQNISRLEEELVIKQQQLIHATSQKQAVAHEQLQHSEALGHWPVQEHTLGALSSEDPAGPWSSPRQSTGGWPEADHERKGTALPDHSIDATPVLDHLTGTTPVAEQVVGNEAAATSTIQWDQPGDDAFSLLHSTQANEQDPASWFDELPEQIPDVSEQPVQQVEELVGQHQAELHQQQEQLQEQQQSEVSVSIEELQYKLSWYEEQWSTWTGHYNELQSRYQEAEQQVAQLTQQLQHFQHRISQETVVKADDADPSSSRDTADENIVQQQKQEIFELENRLHVAETAHEQLKEEHHNLQQELSRLSELEDQLEKLTGSSPSTVRLEEAEAEVDRLRGFETQVYELQSQVQALQHQCTAMQNKLAEAETERTRLLEVEVLYGELQSCIQESETKREGSKSRVQELELMVQSAESEIARLRNEIEVLNQAGQAVETDRERLQTDAQGLGAEMARLNTEVLQLRGESEQLKAESTRLQNENELCRSESVRFQNEVESFKDKVLKLQGENRDLDEEVTRVRSELQRVECENSQLRSELEVMEGEHGRLRSDYEVLEGENNRARGEYEALSQTNQMTEAEKESLESEVQRITAQNITFASDIEHLQGEIQRLTEVSTSAESEITRLRTEIEGFKLLDVRYNELEVKYNELQKQFSTVGLEPTSKITSESEAHSLVFEEVDWSAEGRIEDEHLQRSSSVDLKYQEEIENLKSKVIALEKEKNGFYDELQAAKMKSGKMLQKFKLAQGRNEALSKEVQKLKAKAGGLTDLDQALEEEWKAQVARAETERDELKQKLDEMENEKEHLASQVDVLTAAQEQYLELKEDQDTTIRLLQTRNKELEGQHQALEWRISELEEIVEQQQVQEMKSQASPVQDAVDSGTSCQASSEEVEALKAQVSSLHQEIIVLKSEKERLQTLSEELEEKVESLSTDNASFQSLIERLKEAVSKAENDTGNYKSLFIELDTEHTSLKKKKEKVNEELKELTYAHDTLKAAYNSMFNEYNDLRDVCDSHKYDIGILQGERDRLVEEVDSLKKQLQAFHEEEEEETIRALQDECFSLREQNNLLHEENTALEVQAEDAKEKASRVNIALEQNIHMQDLLRDELVKKNEEISFQTTTIDGQERQLTYMKAEIAAMKTKLAQQDQAEESCIETTEELKLQIEQLQEFNQQLQLQVETAEASLAKLARANEDGGDNVFTSPASTGTELEAALASLHLRELRCQQLSLEITKLLEERDALQLKLSAALRQTQELSRELSLSHQLPAPVSPEPSLDQKLAELRELNDSLEQKALLSLQGSSASMGRRITIGGLPSSPMFTPHTAPPTPTATRHADYTLTREAQGTSSTLIDWILGKSTPRVLHV